MTGRTSSSSRARWNADDLGLAVARLVVALLVPAGEPVTVAIDDTLLRRRGKKVRVASWFGGELKKLPAQATWTTRLRKDAALNGLPPERTGRRGPPRHRGDRLPCLAKLAATTAFTQVTVTRYGKAAAVRVAPVTCL